MTRALRCAACTRRIRGSHAHVGLIDVDSGREISYHARCQQRAAQEVAAMVEQGKAYILRHYHSSRCPDKVPDFGCRGGCFDTGLAEVAN